jgi:hypothetical protein
MKTLSPAPTRLMKAAANGAMRSACELWRNDGYGWKLISDMRCNVHHRTTPPIPGDPSDATAASVAFAEIHHATDIPSRNGDHIKVANQIWTVGGSNDSETFGTFIKVIAARPIAATPLTFINVRRPNTSGSYDLLPPQLVHVAWAKSQPDRVGEDALRRFGAVFAPEGAADLDIRQGDSFAYGGMDAIVMWVPPDPTERREATFWVNQGSGT